MLKAAVALHALRQHFFARMAKWRVPEIVGECNCFRQIFIQRKRPCDGAADRRDFDGMGQPRPKMIAGAIEKDLRLVFQTTEGTRMNDPRAIALKFRAVGM